MATGATQQLGLALPVQGELSGSWGNTVNNGITEYTNIAIAATLTLTGDGAVTLANTTGDASASNIVSTLTGAGTVTAQFAIVKVTGTLTTAKVVTGPSYSKTYVVDNAATGGVVTFKAAGQAGVSVAVGEKCTVYYNGTDYVKVASSTADGVTTIDFGSTGLTPATATSGAVTVAGTLAIANGGTGTTSTTFANLTTNVTGTLPIANGGTGTTSTTFANLTTNVTGTLPTANGGTNLGGATPFTSGGVVYASSSSALATGSTFNFDGTNVGIGTASLVGKLNVTTTLSPILNVTSSNANGGYQEFNNGTIAPLYAGFGVTLVAGITVNDAALRYSNNLVFGVGSSEKARFTSTGGFVVGTTTDPGAGIIADANGNVRTIPQSGSAKTASYTLVTGDIGEYILLGASGAVVIPDAVFSAGDVVSIFNNTASTATITCTITTAYIAGTFTDKATMTLAAAGVATILFITGTTCVVSGNVT